MGGNRLKILGGILVLERGRERASDLNVDLTQLSLIETQLGKACLRSFCSRASKERVIHVPLGTGVVLN